MLAEFLELVLILISSLLIIYFFNTFLQNSEKYRIKVEVAEQDSKNQFNEFLLNIL